MKNNYNYDKTESWFLKEKTFVIEVKHWSSKGVFNGGEFDYDAIKHHWNVYVYVGPKHPNFSELTESYDNYPFLSELHHGCTWFSWERNADGSIASKKYGLDYMHFHDEHFERCDSENHLAAREVFFDAERLFDSFKEVQDYSDVAKQEVE